MAWRIGSLVIFLFSISLNVTAQTAFTPSEQFSDRVFYSFYQGAAANCASIALIKAAIATFGVPSKNGGAFTDNLETSGLHHIILRNGEKLDITGEQLDFVTQKENNEFQHPADGHVEDSDLMKAVYLAYAVMASEAYKLSQNPGSPFGYWTGHLGWKRYHTQGSYEDAVTMLTREGRNADTLSALLGLKFVEIPPTQVDHVAYIQTNYYHAVFAVLDQYDEHGAKKPTIDLDENHRGLHRNVLDAFYLIQ